MIANGAPLGDEEIALTRKALRAGNMIHLEIPAEYYAEWSGEKKRRCSMKILEENLRLIKAYPER